ncbi:MAG: hypothetical protein H6726_09720 [Sandaracinaceae bacterium]|nr:hypothetical protein [Sandaracinaceae bacterium]
MLLSLRPFRPFVLALSMMACTPDAEPAATPSPAPPATEAAEAPLEPFDSVADVAHVSRQPPAPPPGFAVTSRGTRVRLRSAYRTSRRRVDGKRVPTLPLPDPTARAALDDRIAALNARCHVELALPRFVALTCTPRAATDADEHEDTGDDASASSSAGSTSTVGRAAAPSGRSRPRRVRTQDEDTDVDASEAEERAAARERGPLDERTRAALFVIDGSEVRAIEPLDLFIPGTDEAALLRRLQYDPRAALAPVLVTATGIELRIDRHHTARVPYRTLAPWMRADTPLGEALLAAGLDLAPATARPPAAAPETRAIWADEPGRLLPHWRALPTHLKPLARIAHPGGQRAAALIFPPGVTHVGAATEPAYFVGPLAELSLGRATAPLAIVDRPGDNMVRSARPPGTLVTLVRGAFGMRDSDVGDGSWAFVRSGATFGWGRGRALGLLEEGDCGELTPPGDGVTVHEQGVFADGEALYVWFISSARGRGRRFSLHPLEACTPGAVRHEYTIAERAEAIQVFRARRDEGPVLVAVLDRERPSLDSTLLVYAMERDAPVLELRGRVLELEVGVRVGPDRTRGYFPMRVLSGDRQTWYTYTDNALMPVETPTSMPAEQAR